MRHALRLCLAVFSAVALLSAATVAPARAQGRGSGNSGFFIPPKPHIVVPSHPAAHPAPPPQASGPAIPQLPALRKGKAPPAPVIGVLSVPDVLRVSTAARAVRQEIVKRRGALARDAQKEQAAWRVIQQKISADRSKLSSAEVSKREKALQDRITHAQQRFRARNQRIQQAARVAIGQVERTLIAVIRQVAESRGMNLVLHRSQVALNVSAFDITGEVTQQLNKVLPSVVVPPDSAFIPPPKKPAGK